MPKSPRPSRALVSLIACLCFGLFGTARTAQALDLTRPPPLTVTIGNNSFPPQLRSWLPPNKNTTLSALGRASGAITNSSNPANETAAVAKGLALYKSKTSALLKGQGGTVTYVSSVAASPLAVDLRCFVDPATGQLVGLQQGGAVACSPTSDVVVVPTSSGGYISQVKLAYTYDGAFVGRLVFEVKANANAKAVTYTCGSGGGKAVSLLPNSNDYVVTKLNVGCAPLPAINGGSGGSGRRRLQQATSGPGLGLSAGTFSAVAAPLSVLPVDPVTGVPLTQLIGDVLPGSWSVVGTAGFSAGRAGSISLAIDSTGTPYVAYYDTANGEKATVQKFTSGSWSVVGTAGFSGPAAFLSAVPLAIDSTGTPYVAYEDKANGGKATVELFS